MFKSPVIYLFFTVGTCLLTKYSNAQNYEVDSVFSSGKKQVHVTVENLPEGGMLVKAVAGSELLLTDTITDTGVFNLHLPDFNHDGFNDIELSFGAIYDYNYLYLYDRNNHKYRKLDGFRDFASAKQLNSDTSFYFSYQSGGCADMIWTSVLFRIRNYAVVPVASLSGDHCKTGQGTIQIVRILKDGHIKLIERLNYQKYIHRNDDKWKVIEDYWSKNVYRFIK